MQAEQLAIWVAGGGVRELALFAACGLLVGGLDDLAVDLIWLARGCWRRAFVYRRHPRASLETLPPPARPGRIAIFVGAWAEAEVIGGTLAAMLARFGAADYRIYVGAYRNDPATLAAIRHARCAAGPPGRRIRLVSSACDGPTTKAEALNRCWRRLLADEARDGVRAKAVLLHDAEDLVDPGELRLFDTMIERFALVQIPVRPLKGRDWWGVSSTYMDEFAASHGKDLVIREAIGASVPSAGTGTALDRELLGRIADARGGAPFDASSLTEDYEIGLGLARFGGRGAFVRLPARPGGRPIAVDALFPERLAIAVRQKARWTQGIALSGWDRLGWGGGVAETWMRLRDRRTPLAAVVLVAGYASFAGGGLLWLAGRPAGAPPPELVPAWLFDLNLALLGWRLAMRALLTGRAYGWREGLRSGPRMIVSSLITILSGWRAVRRYLSPPVTMGWDKTPHPPHAAVAIGG